MAVKAIKFIHSVARKLLAKPTKPSEGLTSIANRMQAEAKAGEIAETFRASGLTPDKWDDFLKSEKDVTKYLNIIESTRKQALEAATKKSSKDILKTTKKKERPFTGFEPKVVTRSMPADDYSGFKEEWFGKILANTDEALNTFLKRGINASDKRFVGLSKEQRNDFLDMVQYRLKHGNRKFMNDFTDAKGKFNKFLKKENGIDWKKVEETDLDEFAYGGLAGMLGERTGYADGRWGDPRPMSPGTTSTGELFRGFRGSIDEWREQNPQFPSKKIGDYIKPRVSHFPSYHLLSDEPGRDEPGTDKGDIVPFFSKTGKQQIEGAREGVTSDEEVINFVMGLDIPITEKINLLADIGYGKYRRKIEEGGQELDLFETPGSISKNIGFGYDQGDGWSGSVMYNPDTDYKKFEISKKTDFINKWLMGKAGGGLAGMLGEPTYADGGRAQLYLGGPLDAYKQGQKQIMMGAPPEQYDVSQYEAKGYSPGDLDFLRRTQIPLSHTTGF